MYYAYIDDSSLVWGIGTTESAAWRDALRWYCGSEGTSMDDLVIVRLTHRAYKYIREWGGVYVHELPSGKYGLLSEAES